MTWAKLEPTVIQIYRETYTQAEIDGLIAFYKSPVGQASVAKTPQVMRRSLEASQKQMQAFLPRLQEAMKQVIEEAKLTQ